MEIRININNKLVRLFKKVFTKRMVIPGILVLFFISGLILFSDVITKPHEFHTGEVISAEEMNQNFDILYAKVNALNNSINEVTPDFGYAPIGAIVAWHKSMAGTPILPEGWVTCDGQVVTDAESVYNGKNVPDLNDQVYANGRGYYLRGGNTSGQWNESTYWTDNGHAYQISGGVNYGVGAGQYNQLDWTSGSAVSYNSSRLGSSRRFQVAAMTVVWIIRVK